MNVQSLVVIVLRLMSLNFLLRIIVEMTTPLLIFAGIYQRPADDAPPIVAWVLVGSLFVGGIFLWILARPVARLIAKGVPNELSLDNLSLADCYSIAFTGLGAYYIVSRLAGVWNWTRYFLGWLFHRSYVPWGDPNRGYQLASIFVPFIAGVVLIWKRNTWARLLAGRNTHNMVVSFKEPWPDSRHKTSEPVISIEPPRR